MSDDLGTSTEGRAKPRLTMTVIETAEVLGISRTLAYEMVRTKELPSIRLGRRVVVPVPALERLLGIARADSA